MKKVKNLLAAFAFLAFFCSCGESVYMGGNSNSVSMGYRCKVETGDRFNREVFYASKNYVTVNKEINGFDEVKVGAVFDVTYTPSDKSGVEIYAPDNIIECLDFSVSGNKLNIGFKKDIVVYYQNDIKISVTSPKLEGVEIHGTGNFTVKGDIETDHLDIKSVGVGNFVAENIVCCEGINIESRGAGGFRIGNIKSNSMDISLRGTGNIVTGNIETVSFDADVAGSGDINIDRLYCENVKMDVAGTGNIEVEGYADDAQFSVRGTGNISAKGLEVQNVSCEIKGTGNINCHAVKNLTSKVSGIGRVKYKGNPAIKDLDSKLYRIE